jgi:hypothetical protein
MQNALLNLPFINVFQMYSLLQCTYYLNEQETKYVSFYLNHDLKPQVKIGSSSGHAVLNEIQWFILVTFNNDTPKNKVHDLGDSQHTLPLYCGRYICITSENTQVYLSKKDWKELMELASACIDRRVIKFGRLQDELVEWRNKCLEAKTFCTSPNTDAIDFKTLCDELCYRTNLLPSMTKCL